MSQFLHRRPFLIMGVSAALLAIGIWCSNRTDEQQIRQLIPQATRRDLPGDSLQVLLESPLFESFPGSIRDQDFKLASGLKGLWEGILLTNSTYGGRYQSLTFRQARRVDLFDWRYWLQGHVETMLVRLEHVTQFTCQVAGDRASGEVSFKAHCYVFQNAPVYRGRFEYAAVRTEQGWKIRAFRLPATGLRIELNEKDVWQLATPSPSLSLATGLEDKP